MVNRDCYSVNFQKPKWERRNVLVNEILLIYPKLEIGANLVASKHGVMLISIFFYAFFPSHPNSSNFLLTAKLQDIVHYFCHRPNSNTQTASDLLQAALQIPYTLCQKLRTMGSTSPESSKSTSRFWIRTFGALIFNESGELNLLGGEDIQRKKVREAVIFLGNKSVEDRIVRDAQVSPEQTNKNIRVCHLGEGRRK